MCTRIREQFMAQACVLYCYPVTLPLEPDETSSIRCHQGHVYGSPMISEYLHLQM